MKMKPEKIRYSTRNGLTIDFHRPDGVVIGLGDMLALLMFMKGHLTQEEMNREFSQDEQKIIQKYFIELEKKQYKLIEGYSEKASLKKIKSDFRRFLDWWLFCYEEGILKVMTQIWGWSVIADETLPLVDRLILDVLRTDKKRDLARTNYLISTIIGDPKMEDPLPETVARVEAMFGPLDWAALKAEGIKIYHKFHKSKA